MEILRRFLAAAGCTPTWTMRGVVEEQTERMAAQVGKGRAICGLSGGVDSAVAAALVQRAIGSRLSCVFVDHGLLRTGEAEQVEQDFVAATGVDLTVVDAAAEFLAALAGVTDPEEKLRIVGEVAGERPRIARDAGAIARAELSAAGLDREIWQCPVVLLADVRSVGVQGDGRSYGYPVVLRPVTSEDAMTADWARLPDPVLAAISTRITNEVPEINRVVLDVTSKPPATIEWE